MAPLGYRVTLVTLAAHRGFRPPQRPDLIPFLMKDTVSTRPSSEFETCLYPICAISMTGYHGLLSSSCS